MHNPFATHFVSPGKLTFIFTGDDCLETLSVQLAACEWRAQILGPHGSGKSTLLGNLTQHLQSQFEVTYLQPRDFPGIQALPRHLRTSRPALFAIDGLELLPKKDQQRLLDWSRTYQVGLLITTHQPASLPVLYQTRPSEAVFQQIVQKLLGDLPLIFSQQEIAETLKKHNCDIREALFELYDIFEATYPTKANFSPLSAG